MTKPAHDFNSIFGLLSLNSYLSHLTGQTNSVLDAKRFNTEPSVVPLYPLYQDYDILAGVKPGQ